MEPLSFIRALQLTDSFFPVGAFAYSDGLETAATTGQVHDGASLAVWMDHFIDAVFSPCDGLAVMKCMEALRREDFESVCRIDEELSAIRSAGAVRRASTSVGKRLLSLYASMHSTAQSGTLPHGNAAVAYALVYFQEGLSSREAVMAFGYNRLAGIVSAGLRLISIGQQEGQMLLTSTTKRLPIAVDRIEQNLEEPLRSFSPFLDIQQMNHQYVYSRLFRS
jgi:urease accessory protein